MTKGETTTHENLLQTAFELESENERLHDVLDEIRAEIVERARRTMNDTRAEGLYIALDIIDKYRKEQT